jgi:hypothetical protein
VLVETLALVQNRLGLKAIKVFHEDIVPLLSIRWVDAVTHRVTMSALHVAGRKNSALLIVYHLRL